MVLDAWICQGGHWGAAKAAKHAGSVADRHAPRAKAWPFVGRPRPSHRPWNPCHKCRPGKAFGSVERCFHVPRGSLTDLVAGLAPFWLAVHVCCRPFLLLCSTGLRWKVFGFGPVNVPANRCGRAPVGKRYTGGQYMSSKGRPQSRAYGGSLSAGHKCSPPRLRNSSTDIVREAPIFTLPKMRPASPTKHAPACWPAPEF